MKIKTKSPTKIEIKRAKEYISILQAFCEGKRIEFKNENGEWTDCTIDCLWSFDADKYRVKPEPTYRPFTPKEAFENFITQGKTVTQKDTKRTYGVDSVRKGDVLLEGCGYFTFEDILNLFFFKDGSPCGVLIQDAETKPQDTGIYFIKEYWDKAKTKPKYEAWYKDGKFHRLDGPAIQGWYKDGQKEYELWYINGVEYTKEEFNTKKIKSIDWFK